MATVVPSPAALGQGGLTSSVSFTGVTALWIGFAFIGSAAALFFFLSYIRNVKPEARLMYYLVTVINAITALAYLTMALGGVWGQAEYVAVPATHGTWQYTYGAGRGFHWLRFAAYAWVAPTTIVILGILAGAHWVDILWVSLTSMVAVGALFSSAISTGWNATWPLFAFAGAAGLTVAIGLVWTFRIAAYKVHAEIGKLYDVVGLGSLIMYFGYYIVFGVSEAGKITTVDQEVIIYTVLDIITKAGFGLVLLYSREAIARYGTWLGQINTGVDFDFPIARSTVTTSAVNYSGEGGHAIVYGEHRDLAFAQLHGATSTPLTVAKGYDFLIPAPKTA